MRHWNWLILCKYVQLNSCILLVQISIRLTTAQPYIRQYDQISKRILVRKSLAKLSRVVQTEVLVDPRTVIKRSRPIPIKPPNRCKWCDLLSSECEGSTGDGRGELESFRDLTPELLVDDLHKTSPSDHQPVEFVKIEHLFCHDRDAVHRRS